MIKNFFILILFIISSCASNPNKNIFSIKSNVNTEKLNDIVITTHLLSENKFEVTIDNNTSNEYKINLENAYNVESLSQSSKAEEFFQALFTIIAIFGLIIIIAGTIGGKDDYAKIGASFLDSSGTFFTHTMPNTTSEEPEDYYLMKNIKTDIDQKTFHISGQSKKMITFSITQENFEQMGVLNLNFKATKVQ